MQGTEAKRSEKHYAMRNHLGEKGHLALTALAEWALMECKMMLGYACGCKAMQCCFGQRAAARINAML
eukprot:1034248-Alexandrium_andersonii.AAC.1